MRMTPEQITAYQATWPAEQAEADTLLQEWRTKRPDVAITIGRTYDVLQEWDGDGPSPAEDGFEAYVYTVAAQAIIGCTIYTGEAHLGGCWEDPAAPHGMISGYLPQMIEEAIAELDSQLP